MFNKLLHIQANLSMKYVRFLKEAEKVYCITSVYPTEINIVSTLGEQTNQIDFMLNTCGFYDVVSTNLKSTSFQR